MAVQEKTLSSGVKNPFFAVHEGGEQSSHHQQNPDEAARPSLLSTPAPFACPRPASSPARARRPTLSTPLSPPLLCCSRAQQDDPLGKADSPLLRLQLPRHVGAPGGPQGRTRRHRPLWHVLLSKPHHFGEQAAPRGPRAGAGDVSARLLHLACCLVVPRDAETSCAPIVIWQAVQRLLGDDLLERPPLQ